MADYLDYEGLAHFKEKNDELYLEEEDLTKVNELPNATISNEKLLLIGNPDSGELDQATIEEFLNSLDMTDITDDEINALFD